MTHQIEISECKRDCFCKDCDNIRCLHHGKREADCPKYMCDMANKLDCDNCKWLDEWYKEMRKETEDEDGQMTKELAIQILRGEVLGTNEQTHEAVFMAIKALKNEQKKGKWIVTPYTDYDDAWECSSCGNLWTFIEGTPKDNGANYCPNCGARMEN